MSQKDATTDKPTTQSKTADATSKDLAASEAKAPQIQAATRKQMKNVPTVDGYDNFLSRIGLNNDNTLSDGTYTFNLVTRNRVLLEAAYRGSWVVGVVVDAVAEDMTRAGIDLTTAKAFDLKQFFKEMTRLQLWQSICDNVKWGRLYGGSVGVYQILGQDLATPLNLDTIAMGQFAGVSVFDRWQLNPSVTEIIQTGPDMGLPLYYDIITGPQNYAPSSFAPLVPAATSGIIRVHHSRVFRSIGIQLPFFQAITEMMWGESNLERLWDRLIAFDNATMSSGSLIDRANLRTVGVEGLREILAAGGEAQAGLERMFEMMRILQVNEGLTLIDKNDEFQSTAYSFAGLSDMMLQFGQQLAGASGIPLVRFFGQSPAGLSATGEADIRMYYDQIRAQQEAKLRKPIDLLIKIMWRSVFGVPAPDDLEFSFTSLWQNSMLDKAQIGKTNTETVLAAHEGGLISAKTALEELRDQSGDTGLFSNITDEDIAAADEEPPVADEAPMPGEAPAAPGEKDEGPVKNFDARPKQKWFRSLFNADSSLQRVE